MRFYALIVALAFVAPVCSQTSGNEHPNSSDVVAGKTILNQYLDSLQVYKHRLDSLERANRNLSYRLGSVDGRYMRLFAPVNYYGDLAQRRFSLDENIVDDSRTLVDNALLNIYIHHPSFVSGGRWIPAVKPSDDGQQAAVVVPRPQMDVYDAPKAEEIGVDKVDLIIKKPNFWTFKAECYLQMMQNFYSKNWYQGGESNYSALSRVTLWADYNNKQKIKFENKLELQLGFMTNESDTVHSIKTSSDLIRLTSKLGIQASKKWYYTLQVVANSQFMKTFAPNSNNVTSDFMSPFNLNASVGIDYAINWFGGKLTGSVHFAPFSCVNYKYVGRLDLAVRNGIDEGKHGKLDYGSSVTLDINWKFSDRINWRSRLYGYTTLKRAEVTWENTFDLKIARFLSASIYLYPRFDDSSIQRKDGKFGYFQLKEYTSLGLTYSF